MKLITVEYIKRELNRIKATTGDYETAHSMENQLHHDVLEYIAKMNPTNAAQLAGVALRSSEIDFVRHYV